MEFIEENPILGETKIKKLGDRKTFFEATRLLLDLRPTDKDKVKELEDIGVSPKDIDNRLFLILKAFKKAEEGDIGAMTFLRDTAGDKPYPPKILR